MARYTNVSTNFSGGLITDNLVGRTDLARTANSCRKLDNFFPTLQGPAEYRQGFEVVVVDGGYSSENYVRQVNIILATRRQYRCVFYNLGVKIYDAETNVKKDELVTPYTTSDLKDLRFSAETDILYITHQRHRPRKLTTDITYGYVDLQDSGSNPLNDSNSTPLRVSAPLSSDDNWTLTEIQTFIEPFLEKDTSGIALTAVKGSEIVKITSTGSFSTIASSITAGNSYWVEYVVDNTAILGKVLLAADVDSNDYPEVADPTNDVVYVDAVDFVTEVSDSGALFQLIDNSTTNDAKYVRDGVPNGEIHLRCDTAVFSAEQAGTWIKVSGDRVYEEDVVGTASTDDAWVKISKFVGTEAHPIDFKRTAATSSYDFGHIYRSFGAQAFTVFDHTGTQESDETAVVTAAGNQVFSWVGGSFSATPTLTGDLTTAVAFAIHKCDVSVGDNGIVTGAKLIKADATAEIEIIANDVSITANGPNSDTFFNVDDVGRYIKLDYSQGVAYAKIVERSIGKQVRALLRTAIPRNASSSRFENDGTALSFSLGAWYNNNYPREVVQYERRRVYAGTPTHPNLVFFSKLNDETDFSPTEADGTVIDTNGITYPLGNLNASVRWLVAESELVIGTTRGIFRLVANQYEAAVSPKTIRIELADEINCAEEAHVVGTSIFFPDKSASKLMEYKYDGQNQRSTANDLAKFIYPTFVEDNIQRIAIQANPQPRIWVLTKSGLLYVLTYHRHEDYYAWSLIKTENPVVDIICTKEGFKSGGDKVVIASRENSVLQFETMYSPINTIEEPKEYLDGSYRATIPEISSFISNGDLNINYDFNNNFVTGQTLSLIVNGVYYGEGVYTDGYPGNDSFVITNWTGPTSGEARLVFGKKYTGELQPMYPTWNGQNRPAFGSDEIRVVSTKLHLIDSSKFKIGIGGNFEQITLPSNNYTGFDIERPVVGSTFGAEQIPVIKQDEPYGLTLTAMITKTDLNG